MKKQVKIRLDPSKSDSEKGAFFEKIVRHILETQRYEITERVNFTAMEIDLIAKHKDRTETAYIECKAKERLGADEIRVFAFNVQFQEANYGYFISTSEFEHQVAGLIEAMKGKEEYSNLYFWGPSKIIELLESSNVIKHLSLNIPVITKIVLAWTYFGIFYILILIKNTLPAQFYVIDAETSRSIVDNDLIKKLKENIVEIKDLEYVKSILGGEETEGHLEKKYSESVIEVQESEHWYDYLPASSKHFIGRKSLLTELLDFIEQVSSKKTSRRVFYIDGKSGWGKSSLITCLRGMSKNKRYSNRFYILAVDARSASSSNFIALSFKKLINDAKKDKFLRTSLFYPKLDIISSFDVLGSESAKGLLSELENQNKLLILIFDQFEDVFRKPGLYAAFNKFLHDVNGAKSNLILGFSWKSEINVPIEHEAYYLWQQGREFTTRFTVKEFEQLEIEGVISQLEKSINCHPIDPTLKRKLIESSQGFPWLIKKLCIHVYQQIKSKKTIESLIEQELNCKALFDDDLEGLGKQETSALKYIARRSYEGNFFETTDVDEKIDEPILAELVNKRLVVKFGTKYNVYWDIFRDYLVTDEVPPIGESYLLRQYVNVCFKVYKLFDENNSKLSLERISELHPRKPGTGTIDNVLRELRNIGLVQKVGDSFQKSSLNVPGTEEGFRNYMKDKFAKYTPYQKLKQIETDFITLSDIVLVLKDTFKATYFEEKTWNIYAKYLVSWFSFANLDIMDRFVGDPNDRRKMRQETDFMPDTRPKSVIKVFSNLIKNPKRDCFKNSNNALYELKNLGLITYRYNRINLTEKGNLIKDYFGTPDFEKMIAIEAMKLTKIAQASRYLLSNPMCSRDEFGDGISNILNVLSSEKYRIRSRNILYSWAEFVNQHLNNPNNISE